MEKKQNKPEKGASERQERLRAVRRLIKNNRIESQETLLSHLETEGFAVTQATLSRDLKALKVGKVSDGKDGYIYELPDDELPDAGTFVYDFVRGFVSIEWSGNMVVIKTYSGHSDSVAMALDSFGIDLVLGTISGRDNTVFVVLKEGFRGEDFLDRIGQLIPNLKDEL